MTHRGLSVKIYFRDACVKISIFSARICRVRSLRLEIASSASTVNGDLLEFLEWSRCRNFLRRKSYNPMGLTMQIVRRTFPFDFSFYFETVKL